VSGFLCEALAQTSVPTPAKALTQISKFPPIETDENQERLITIKNAKIPAALFTSQVLEIGNEVTKSKRNVSLKLINSKIEGDVNFEKKSLPVSFNLEKVTFAGNVNFRHAEFGRLIISDSLFENGASFDHATFHQTPSFYRVTFNQRAVFSDASFREAGYFMGTTFRGNALFERAIFVSSASFREATFEQAAVFESGTVGYQGIFDRAMFKGPAGFSYFTAVDASFSDAVFNDLAIFDEAKFSKQVSFSNTSFKADAAFEDCEFPPIDWQQCTGGLVLTDAKFEKQLWLPFKQLVQPSSWFPFINPPLKMRTCGMATYQRVKLFHGLKEKFKSLGDVHALNNVEYFEHAAQTRRENASRWERFRDYFSELLWGYGFRPWRPLFWLLVFMILFALLYWTQTKQLIDPHKRWQWARWRFAWLFSWHATFKLKPITDRARSLFFKVVVLGQWAISKALLLLFIKALAKNIPLVGELVNQLIPV
jgi:uncharacterized protein YjbI with pentapeptide repeats